MPGRMTRLRPDLGLSMLAILFASIGVHPLHCSVHPPAASEHPHRSCSEDAAPCASDGRQTRVPTNWHQPRYEPDRCPVCAFLSTLHGLAPRQGGVRTFLATVPDEPVRTSLPQRRLQPCLPVGARAPPPTLS